MKPIYLICGIVISISCSNSTQNQAKQESKPNQDENGTLIERQNPDSNAWEKSFREFSNAILENDRERVKSFFDFPIRSKGNEIWFLADSKFVMEMNSTDIVPFTEADFDEYYHSIFSTDFIKTLQKLSLEEFFLNEKASSPEIEVVKDSKSKLFASYNNTLKKLTLTLSAIIKTKGEHDTGFSVFYEFDLLKDQKIKFKQVKVDMP